ncbi:MAG: ubiquinol oxidase subunit II [Acetobacteraceae bacterium]|nr:ubiquinol oxidase subunit II [Acetobacteraceae bacterium]
MRLFALLPLFGLLAGCKLVVLDPAGDVAMQQRDIVILSTALMLIIVVPVLLLTVVFAWWYRDSNIDAVYDPEFHHSTQLEVVIWSAPLVIIVALGLLTWISTHLLDPFRPLGRVNGAEQVAVADTKPLRVQVVALDWKWLFIYPDQGIGTVNELAVPVNVPVTFELTSSDVMNSFFVPAMAGQIYTMPGMQTKLHAVLNRPGEYTGMSSQYSGSGFSDMYFTTHGLSGADFEQWVGKVKADGTALGRTEYLNLAQPSEREPVHHYKSVDPGLFAAVLDMCVEDSKTCKSDMMHGGGRRVSQNGRPAHLPWAERGKAAPNAYASALGSGVIDTGSAICTASNATGVSVARAAEPTQRVN